MQLCNFLDWRNLKLVYKRYASLYFVCAIDQADNELLMLDGIHHFVEVLDKHFSNVCELDLVFNFFKAYWLLDEVFLAGEVLQFKFGNMNAMLFSTLYILISGKPAHAIFSFYHTCSATAATPGMRQRVASKIPWKSNSTSGFASFFYCSLCCEFIVTFICEYLLTVYIFARSKASWPISG
jgi:hypothetical protein